MIVSKWKLVLCGLLMCLSGYLGWQLHPESEPVVTTVDRIQTRIVTVEKRPDGTVIERTETSDQKRTEKERVVASSKQKYSTQVNARVGLEKWMPPSYDAMLFRRIGDTNAWAGVGYNYRENMMLLGIRIDF